MMKESISVENKGVVFKDIPTYMLKAGTYQPRQQFEKEGLKSLSETIRRVGVLEPLLVRLSYQGAYEIIAGERRWRAAKMAGLKTVPCLVGSYTDEKTVQMALIENLNREDLNPIDQAAGIQRIVMEFGYTHEEVGAILGLPRSQVTNLLRLLKLDERVQDILRKGELSTEHGKILAGIAIERQYFFAKQCIEKQWSVKRLNETVKESTAKDQKEPKTRNQKDVDILRLEQEISDQFGHTITFSLEKNKAGTVNIHFYNLDGLNIILSKLKSLNG